METPRASTERGASQQAQPPADPNAGQDSAQPDAASAGTAAAGVVPRRLPMAAAALSAPATVLLLALAALGEVAPATALIAIVILAGATTLLLAQHFKAVAALRRYVELLRGRWDLDAPIPAPPELHSPGLDPTLGEVIAETARERQHRRRELRAAIASSEAIVSALPDALLVLDPDSRVLRANQAAEQLLGSGLVGRHLTEILRNPQLLNAADSILAGSRDAVAELTLPGSVQQHLVARLARLDQPGPDGGIAILALHDVTGLRRAEQMRADFVANASHELRTPLASLLGFVETLQGPARDDAQARASFLEIMREQAQRMQQLIEDLLSLSRIELDEHSQPNGQTNLYRLLGRVRDTVQLRAARRQMSIEMEMDDRLPTISGDEDQLMQVFQNLVDNAVKYGRSGTPVRIQAKLLDAQAPGSRRLGRPAVAVSVIDQGEGIAREHIPRLTERFYRVDAARSRSLGGTGLGLAIVKHILNRHRGRLEVESERGKGSCFTVLLPQTQGQANGISSQGQQGEDGASGSSAVA